MTIQKLSLILLLQGCLLTANGQADQHWLVSGGGELADHANAVTADAEGNTYITGGFQSYSVFTDWTLSSKGDTDIFLAKYDGDGNLVWMRSAGSDMVAKNTVSEAGNAVAVFGEYVYVTGTFNGKGLFEAQAVTSAGGDDIFLAQYTRSGDLQWVRRAGGESQDIPYALTCDKAGNVYITGTIQQSASFGSHTLTATDNQPAMFVCKYDPSGQVVWARLAGVTNAIAGTAIQCDGQRCIVAGNYTVGDYRQVAFLAQYDLNGVPGPVTRFGKSSGMTINDLALQKDGTVITGAFTGSIAVQDKVYTSRGISDAYIGKLDANGDFLWIKTFGNTGMDSGQKLSTTPDGQLVLVGNFQIKITAGDDVLTSAGGDDAFLITLSPNGELQRAERFGGTGQDRVTGVVATGTSAVMTGYFRSELSVGNQQATSKGLSDIFIHKLPVPATTPATGGEEPEIVTVYPNPSVDDIIVKAQEPIRDVKIHNLAGQCVYTASVVNARELKINVRSFKAGVYIVSVDAGRATHDIKWVRP